MNDWTSGYVSQVDYLYGYYPELNPWRIRLAFLSAGLVFPEVSTACELGFGQGVSINVHAAASNVAWYGTDFNPSQTGFAQELAKISGSGAMLYDDAFAEFARRTDLPDFDFIGLHGIWSWISDENRAVIVDFIRRKLKVGGVLYISYNTQPGWGAMVPMRELLTEHAMVLGAAGHGIVSRIDGALDFADKLFSTSPAFARANPEIEARVKKLRTQNKHYLAHEYFNRDWHPMSFSSMAKWLMPAKLDYACSANLLDHVDAVNLTQEQQAFLKEIPDPLFRESVRDFMTNQRFRRDYWVKGVRKMPGLERSDRLRDEKFALITPRDMVKHEVPGASGEVTLQREIYQPILDALAISGPKTLGELEKELSGQDLRLPHIAQAITVLVGKGDVQPVQPLEVAGQVGEPVIKLNTFLLERARLQTDIAYLASPVTGGAIAAPRFHQLFLLAISEGKATPDQWAAFAWTWLAKTGQSLFRKGERITNDKEAIEELEKEAVGFAEKRLPLLQRIGVSN